MTSTNDSTAPNILITVWVLGTDPNTTAYLTVPARTYVAKFKTLIHATFIRSLSQFLPEELKLYHTSYEEEDLKGLGQVQEGWTLLEPLQRLSEIFTAVEDDDVLNQVIVVPPSPRMSANPKP